MTKTQEVCEQLVGQAQTVATKFETLLKLFAKCHRVYNSGGHISDNEIQILGN